MGIKQFKLQLRVVWLENFLGLAVDNVILNQSYSLTPYYFWPKTEALEQLKLELDSKLWLCQEDKVKILKLAGDVISYWFSNRDLKTAKKNFTEDFPEVKILIFNN
jgi:30S ribosomal protein 3